MCRFRSILCCGALSAASAVSIADLPPVAQKDNIIRVSRQACDGCATLEDFYASNKWVSVLFYERFLVNTHRYKEAIIKGFHDTCRELRWSRVVCGVVDMVDDRVYAERYIDPKTAPAHIIVRDGKPLMNEKHHLERLLKKPGDKETMLWHLQDLLVPEDVNALETTVVVKDAEKLSSLFKKHRAVIVAAADSAEKAEREEIRTIVRNLYLGGASIGDSIPWMIEPPDRKKDKDSEQLKRGTKRWRQWSKMQQKRRVVVAVLQGTKALQGHDIPDGHAVGFLDGKRLTQPRMLYNGSSAGVSAGGDALRSVILETVRAASQPNAKTEEL